MIHFVNRADHIAAANAAIVKARQAQECLRQLAEDLSWLEHHRDLACAPATEEQLDRHEKVRRDSAKEMGAAAKDLYLQLPDASTPRYRNPELHAKFVKRNSETRVLLDTLRRDFDELQYLMKQINAGGRWDFLPLVELWLECDPKEFTRRFDDAVRCVDDAGRKADEEKQQVLSGESDQLPSKVSEKRPRGRPPDTDANLDQRIFDAWSTGEHQSYENLAHEMGMSKREIELAIDRHKKRDRRTK